MKKLFILIAAVFTLVSCSEDNSTDTNIEAYESTGEHKNHTSFLVYKKNDHYEVQGNVATFKYYLYNHNIENSNLNFAGKYSIKKESESIIGNIYVLKNIDNITLLNTNNFNDITTSIIDIEDSSTKILMVKLDLENQVPFSYDFNFIIKDNQNHETRYLSKIRHNLDSNE